jgi:hypothetical protein
MSKETTIEDENGKVIHAAGLYAEMSVPFGSIDELNDAWMAFQTELRELRKKHRVRDVTIICEGSFMLDGEPAEARVCSHTGSTLRKLPSLAFAYGEAKAEQELMLAEQEKHGAKRARTR